MTSYADYAARRVDDLRNRPELADVDLVIEQRIVDGEGLTLESYQLAMRDGSIEVDRTCAVEPDIVIRFVDRLATGSRGVLMVRA